MVINVQNITSTSATATWPTSPSCFDSFYRVMYHPSWNSLLMGYSRKNLLRSDRVPGGQSTVSLAGLSPRTTYVLCVTCQSTSPTGTQCQMFDTVGEENTELDSEREGLSMGLWLASSILLLLISGVLLCSCLHAWYRQSHDAPEGTSGDTDVPRTPGEHGGDTSLDSGILPFPSCGDGETLLPTAVEKPLHSPECVLTAEPDQELGTLAKHSHSNSSGRTP